jgi:hypothetical protein
MEDTQMIALHIRDVAKSLQLGSLDPVSAGRQLEAYADGVRALEDRLNAMERAARSSVLNGIGMMTALADLERSIPRPILAGDGMGQKE